MGCKQAVQSGGSGLQSFPSSPLEGDSFLVLQKAEELDPSYETWLCQECQSQSQPVSPGTGSSPGVSK